MRWIWVNTSPVIITIILVARTERKGRGDKQSKIDIFNNCFIRFFSYNQL